MTRINNTQLRIAREQLENHFCCISPNVILVQESIVIGHIAWEWQFHYEVLQSGLIDLNGKITINKKEK